MRVPGAQAAACEKAARCYTRVSFIFDRSLSRIVTGHERNDSSTPLYHEKERSFTST